MKKTGFKRKKYNKKFMKIGISDEVHIYVHLSEVIKMKVN